jgi:hypothetical protein
VKTKNHKPEKKHEYNIRPDGKNDVGRPPIEFKPEYCQNIIDYFKNASKTKRVLKSHTTGKNEYEKDEYEEIACELPTLTKWRLLNGIGKSTFYKWKDTIKEFSDALDEVSEIYKDFLNDNGLGGYYNPLYTKFVATNTTDMKDKTETDLTLKTYEHFSKEKEKFGK